MSHIASQIILHPVVTQTLKVWATTVGRDKTYRAIQYFARFYAWFLIRNGWKEESLRWNSLKSSLGSGRKLMRLFKPVEHLQSALKATQNPSLAANPLEQITTIARQLSYAGYLTFDSIAWANSIRFLSLNPTRAAKTVKTSLRFWLAGILLSIIHGILKTTRLAKQAKVLEKATGNYAIRLGSEAETMERLKMINGERATTRLQFVIDVLDVWLPASGLGLVNLNDGIAGILGFITSVIAFRSHWAAVNK